MSGTSQMGNFFVHLVKNQCNTGLCVFYITLTNTGMGVENSDTIIFCRNSILQFLKMNDLLIKIIKYSAKSRYVLYKPDG